MKKYSISGAATVSCWTTVIAGSKKEALEIAEGRELAGLTIAAFSESSDESFHFDNDGSPLELSVDGEQ